MITSKETKMTLDNIQHITTKSKKEWDLSFFFFEFFYFYFYFFICSEFCHTLKWNSHGGSFFYKLKYICLNTNVRIVLHATYHKVFPLKFDLSLLSSLLFNFILQITAPFYDIRENEKWKIRKEKTKWPLWGGYIFYTWKTLKNQLNKQKNWIK